MFGFLNSREVSDDAVRMVHSVEQILRDLETIERAAFDLKYAGVGANVSDQDGFAFKVRHEPDFVFHYNAGPPEASIAALGEAKYAGFALYPKSESYSEWYCSAKDGIAFRATAGAYKMVKVLKRKYGIDCLDSIF